MNRALYLAGRMQVAFCQILAILCALTASASAAELTLTPSSDTSFHENAPDNNMGLNVWVSAGASGGAIPVRALFQFDLAGIPAGATILSAQLRLTVTGVPFTSGT